MAILWLIIGLIIGGAALWLFSSMRRRNFSVRWYEWLIGAVGFLLLMFSILNYGVALTEPEPAVAKYFLIWFGIPAIVLMALAWQLVYRHNKAA